MFLFYFSHYVFILFWSSEKKEPVVLRKIYVTFTTIEWSHLKACNKETQNPNTVDFNLFENPRNSNKFKSHRECETLINLNFRNSDLSII